MTRVAARVFFKSIILSLCVLWSAQYALATTVVRPLDDDMVIGARAIITGKVLKVESAIDQQDRIFTYITVKVTEVIKGQITERRIILKEFGGVVGDRVSVVYGNPQFTRGERVLLYLGTHNDGSLRTYQMFLGKFSIVTDEATGKTFAVRDNGGANVTVLTAQGHQGGESTDRMELLPYTELVRTKLAANLDRSNAFEQTYYNNIPVLAIPPGFVSSKKTFHSEYTFLGNVRWFQPDTGLPVPYTVNPDPGPAGVSPDPADIAAAVGAWTGISGCSLTFSYAGTLNNCYTQTGTPGINFVSNNCDGHNQPSSGCANILAIGGWSGGGSQTRVLGGITFGQITQGFVSFNPWASCYFGDHCNFREIATHEAGHALGLAHSADSTATMAAYAHFDGRCASIKLDDTNGIKFLYPGSGGPGPLTVTTAALSGGTVGSVYSQTLTASGGTVPYTWSLVAGGGTLPPGLGLNAGIITGTPNTQGTYNFTVRVTDAPGGTATKPLSIVVVPAGSGPLNAQFVSQSVPTSLQPGQQFEVNMKFLNTGTETWGGLIFYLASQNPALNSTWGGNALSLSSFTVSSGQQLDVTFSAVAPLTAGTYNFQWQAYKNDGTGFFGQMSPNVAVQVGATTSNDNVGLYDPVGGAFYFKYANSSGPADYAFTFGPANQGWTPVVGDWNGDGVKTIALYYPVDGAFFIRNSNSSGIADIYITYGPAGQGWIPVIGDWDGNGTETVGLYNPGNGFFYLRNSNSLGYADMTFAFGPVGQGWKPIVGDWNGDGVDTVGLYNPATGAVQLRNSNTTGAADVSFTFTGGTATSKAIVGDWDGNGTRTLGLYNPATGSIMLRNSNTTGGADITIAWEPGSYVPVAGKWR